MVTFAVDEVTPVLDRMARVTHGPDDVLVSARPPGSVHVVDHGPTHAMLGAVYTAFAQHRPLVLTPDAIWLTIAQGVAHHVRLHAERLRSRLVRHHGTKELRVPVGAVPEDAAGWAHVIPQFRDALAHEIGDGRARLFECAFSTSTPIDRIASQVVLMDAYAPFFDLWMMCVCGIPEITLTGTPADWREIRSRIDVIAELELESWCRSLRPILDHFIRAAEGRPDRAFWQRICKPADAYGGEVVTGWIARLYPYVIAGSEAAHPNPLLALPIDEPKHTDDWPPGIKTSDVIAGPCAVRIQIAGLTATRAVQLEAGVQIVIQDDEGRLVPASDWHLRPARARIQDLADRIVAEHRAARAEVNSIEEGSAELVAFYNLVSTASLFDGRWTIRSIHDHEEVTLAARSSVAKRVIDGVDGRFLGYLVRRDQHLWVLGYPDRADLDQVGTTLAEVLDVLLDTGEPPAPGERVARRGTKPQEVGAIEDDSFADEEPTW